MDTARLVQIIPRFSRQRVQVVGDIVLDEYLIGRAERLSREAPIPVLELVERKTIPGGAANPAVNVTALGGEASLVGLVGDDAAGTELVAQLRAAGIDASGIIKDGARKTTQKTRIVTQETSRFPQQLARLDRVDRFPPSEKIAEKIILQLKIGAPVSSAVLLSDYRNGMLTRSLVEAAITACHNAGNLLIVDSQGNLDKYRGCDVIRANDRDTAAFLNRPLKTESDFETATAKLLDTLDTRAIVIGRGADGVSLRGRNTPYHHFPAANPSEVFDVTGAGDTSVAVLALGIVSGLDLAQAAFLANIAAGLVVLKLGNATVSPEELANAVEKVSG